MGRWSPALALSLALLGCPEDEGEPPGDDDAAGEELDLEAFSAQVVRAPSEVFYDLQWVDDGRLIGVEWTETGEAFCPDCVDIPIEDCPEDCERDLLDLWTLDHDGQALASPVRVVTYFPPLFDHDLGGAQLVPLWDGNLGLIWQECDNSVCGGVFSARSCDTRYQRLDPEGVALAEPVTLIEGWFGDVQLLANPDEEQLLLVYSTMVGCYSGVLAATFDLHGAPLSPWRSLGSLHGNVPAPSVHEGGFVVAVDDPEHGGPPAAPCATSCECECGAFPSTSGEDAGLSAWWFDPGGAVTREVITTSAEGDDIAWHQQLAIASHGDALAVAGVPSSLPVTVYGRDDGGGWSARHAFDPPGSLWFELQATPAGTFWIGSEATDPQGDYLMTQLVVGAARPDGVAGRGAIEDPLRGYVFDFAVTGGVAADGGARVFALRGIFPEESTGEWERFEIVRVDAASEWAVR